MDSIFSKIIKNEILAYKIAENKCCLAFLDNNPLKKGHILVVPKKQVDKLFDLETKDYLELMEFTKKVALSLERIIPCQRVGIAVLGFEIAHAHIHLVPMDRESDLDFSKKRSHFSKEGFEGIAEKLRKDFDLS